MFEAALSDIGRNLSSEVSLREAINNHILNAAKLLAQDLRSGVTEHEHIASTVKGWDDRALFRRSSAAWAKTCSSSGSTVPWWVRGGCCVVFGRRQAGARTIAAPTHIQADAVVPRGAEDETAQIIIQPLDAHIEASRSLGLGCCRHRSRRPGTRQRRLFFRPRQRIYPSPSHRAAPIWWYA
jgi:hypothetical protein